MIDHNKLTEEEAAIGQIAANIIEVPLEKFLHANYHPYAYYVIRNRALVSTDGLKPVQRRILYSMFVNKTLPNASYVKAAKVASDVMGDYHPHGNTSIEDALARVAQTFSMRIPLVDPYGSVGYFTGDKPAAARYWEARLTKAAVELLSDLKNDAIPMSRNYSDTLPEPTLLPVKWPNVLINGTEGIAVGYASKCFPHNPTEVMNVAIELVKNPNMTIDEVLKIMPGPDFPTGGELLGVSEMKENYTSGSGGFTVRGRYKIHKLPRNRSEIVFYELPYQVSGDTVVAEIHKLQNPDLKTDKKKKTDKNKKKPELLEIAVAKDLSDSKRGLQLSLKLKTGANPDLVLETLFQKTSLSKKFSLNNTVLESGTPTQVTLIELFEQFLDLRRRCIASSLESKSSKLRTSLENLNGLISVLVDLDKAIAIIRESTTDDEMKINLMNEFSINDSQAEYVLSLQLRRLSNSDKLVLTKKTEELSIEIDEIDKILSSKENFNNELIRQLKETKKIIDDPRRTVINTKTTGELEQEIAQAKIQEVATKNDSEYILTYYADGNVSKQLSAADAADISTKIPSTYKLKANTSQQLYAVLEDGRGIKFPFNYIPFNQKVNRETLGLPFDFIAIGSENNGGALLVVTNKGKVALLNGKIPNQNEFALVSLDEGEKITKAIWVDKVDFNKNIVLGASSGIATVFPLNTLRVSGFGTKAIKGMNLSDDEKIVGASIVGDEGKIVSITPNSIKITELSELPVRGRGTRGVKLHRTTLKTGNIVEMYADSSENISATDKLGNEISLPPANARAASGLNFGGTIGLIFGTKPKNNDI